ncbi:hypothetical protein FF1_028018 [Malus domestica]
MDSESFDRYAKIRDGEIATRVTVKTLKFNNTIACAMHYVVEEGNEGDALLSYDDLERIHMKPYLDCISQGVCTANQ